MPAPSGLGNIHASLSPNPPPLTTASSGASETATSNSLESMEANVWSPELQQQFIQALRAASQQSGAPPELPHLQPRQISQRTSEGIYSKSREESAPPFDAQLASLFAAGPKGTNASMVQEQKPKTLWQKSIPIVHVLGMWCLLLWFVIWGGGSYSYAQEESTKQQFWEGWADLSRRPPPFKEQNTGVVCILFFSWPNSYVRFAEYLLGICNASDRSPFNAPIFRLCMLLHAHYFVKHC